ncbi:hypothetical protein RI129_005331 [Pyrocoelia pectoralis]|uniref:Uncharacterized protein n=1 Tax=Pyrocoelia pectoralis TaxID=417401 RepID=A0AAN7ZLF0_9COLE
MTAEEPPILNHFANNNDITGDNNVIQPLYNSTTQAVTNDNNLDTQIGEINSNIIETINEYSLNEENMLINDNYSHNKVINNSCVDNSRPKMENLKKCENGDENLNCSTNSLVSDNLSSPMQTSTDVFLDSEILSTDAASNDSHSPKSTEKKADAQSNLLEIKRFNEFCLTYNQSGLYASNENVSNAKSDQSLLNSAESCDSSPLHKINRDYKKPPKKYKSKKHFGVKTLQSIFSRHDGYSDISSTASELDDITKSVDAAEKQEDQSYTEDVSFKNGTSETCPQFEENLHHFLSETFSKNFSSLDSNASITINKSTGTKKFFKLNGQHLRIGKALRLCPNDELGDKAGSDNDQKKDKLLARYVYNSNLVSVDGIGDPDFGTPV